MLSERKLAILLYTTHLLILSTNSQHENFEQSTEEIAPLTEEEKKQKLAELREKAKEKKAKQSIIDKEEAKRNEVRVLLFLYIIRLHNYPSTFTPTPHHTNISFSTAN